jgi:indole-3-glycerol phosphate synthase/phosphoribosylanthranilate isomerase
MSLTERLVSVLDEIVARKRADVSRRMEAVSYEELRGMAKPTTRSLRAALARPGTRFILECKKASPSEGLIRKNFDINTIARAYKSFADAVSVLIDEPYFQGSPDNLRRARELLDCPILAKDFVLGPYQVREARTFGADAVLLMLSVLDDDIYRVCAEEARKLGMDVITEVHGLDELNRAIALDARIIGVNNRNLKTLGVDLGVISQMASRIPEDRTIICESGITSRGDVMKIRDACPKVRAFLVGGALMKAPDLDAAVRRLVFGRVKVCGLTSVSDARIAYESGASFGGLIFAAESPRRVDDTLSEKIVSSTSMPFVGVFVNERAEVVKNVAYDLELAAVQLHGDEDAGYVAGLRETLPKDVEIWRASRVEEFSADFDKRGADRALFDTYARGCRGGTGRVFDWSILEGAGEGGFVLAGGVTPDNSYAAMKTGAYALDVSSGVEFTGKPGKKDPEKIKKLFDNLRG